MYKQATQKTGEVLSLPPRWLGMYSDFITKNSSAVTQIESALRSLTYIIPGAHGSMGLLSDTILTSPRTLPGIGNRIRVSYVARLLAARLLQLTHE